MLSINTEELEQVIQQAVDKAIKKHALKEQLPPLLTRKQFMELVDIGATKCNELFNRADFPVIREFGHPRVPTKEFLEWVSANTQNRQWGYKHIKNKDLLDVV